MSSNPAEWNLRINLTGLREELAKIPGITEAEAKKMTAALAQQFKETEKAARAAARAQTKEAKDAAKAQAKAQAEVADAAKAAAKEWERAYAHAAKENAEKAKAVADAMSAAARRQEGALRGVEKAGRIVGGPIGELTDLFGDLNDMLDGTGTGFGKLALGAGATAGALAVVAGAAVLAYGAMSSLADNTREAVQRLNEIDGAADAGQDVADALDEWDQATLRLEASTAKLTTQIGEKLIPVASKAVGAVTRSFSGYSKLVDALADGSAMDAMADGFDRLGRAATAGIRESHGLQVETRQMAVTVEEDMIDLGEAAEAIARGQAAAAKSAADAEDRRNEQMSRAKAAAAELAETERMRATILRGLGEQTEDRRIVQAYADQLAAIDALLERTKDLGEAEKLRYLATQDFAREQQKLADRREKEERAKEEEKRSRYERAIQAGFERTKDETRAAAESAEEQEGAYLDAASSITGAISDFTDLAVEGMDKNSAAYAGLFAAQKAAAVANVLIGTEQAAITALAVPPPAGEALAAARRVQGAVSLAAIAATTFAESRAHSGSSGIAPDEQVVLKSEGVLSHLGKQALGGSAGVAAVNRGEPPGSGGSVSVLQWRNRIMDAPINEMGRMQGSAIYKLKRGGKRVGMRAPPNRNRST